MLFKTQSADKDFTFKTIICFYSQLFHIDFGHFMNHPKHKYGIKRERTPLVFTDSFVRVITKAKEKPRETEEFKE